MAENATPGDVIKTARKRRGLLFYGCLGGLVLLLVVVATAAGTSWWVSRQLNAKPFEPVALDAGEQADLREKMQVLERDRPLDNSVIAPAPPPEDRGSVTISEREINALLAKNTGLAEQVYLDLDDDQVKARVNLPLEPEFPVLGGRTVRLTLTLGILLENEQLRMHVADISVGGFPLPNAWLGGIKNVDLIREYFSDDPAMQAFVEGIEAFKIDEDGITLVPAP